MTTIGPARHDQAPAPGRLAQRGEASSLAQLRTLSLAMLRGFFRDKAALFFTFFFPLMFLVVLGLIFGGSAETKPTAIGVVGSGPVISALPPQVVKPQPFDSLDQALEQVRAGDLPAVLVEDGDDLTLRFSAADPVGAATIRGIIASVVNQANLVATGQPPRFTLTAEQVESADLQPIQFITPGILSWAVATSAAFGAALVLVSWRRKQILRRVRLSPAPVWTVLGARVGVSLVVALVQAAVFIGVALTPPFGLRLSGDWWLAIPLLVAGTLAFLAVGLFVGAVAKTEEAASAIANFVVLPMAFLSGTFFDISQAPGWLQTVSLALPLRHLNDGMLDVLVRGRGVEAIVWPTVILLGFAAAVVAIASRLFRWEDS
ncbi:MAG TPA: ABC transporter permease [Actinomycetes bacterium]|nr:ABC transporter permease [Actinomycetes bacterium]